MERICGLQKVCGLDDLKVEQVRHCLSDCLSAAFPTAFPLSFRCLSLTISLPFRCLSDCLSLAFSRTTLPPQVDCAATYAACVTDDGQLMTWGVT